MNTDTDQKRIVAEIDTELWEQVDIIRQREGMTWVGLISKLLKQWLKEMTTATNKKTV